MQNPSMHISS